MVGQCNQMSSLSLNHKKYYNKNRYTVPLQYPQNARFVCAVSFDRADCWKQITSAAICPHPHQSKRRLCIYKPCVGLTWFNTKVRNCRLFPARLAVRALRVIAHKPLHHDLQCHANISPSSNQNHDTGDKTQQRKHNSIFVPSARLGFALAITARDQKYGRIQQQKKHHKCMMISSIRQVVRGVFARAGACEAY